MHRSWITLLIAFWAGFWLLNAGDKVFNGTYQPLQGDFASSGVIYDAEGAEIGRIQPMETTGGYGVNRDNKMAAMFARIGAPRSVSLALLYGAASMEGLIGLWFLILLLRTFRGYPPTRGALDKAHRASAMVFAMFCMGDILIGERMELWEHCCFLILVLVSNLYAQKEN